VSRGTGVGRFIETRVLLPLAKKLLSFAPVDDRRGWWRILESYAGSWQQHVQVDLTTVDAYWANFSCVTLIAGDIAKMYPCVMEYSTAKKIWEKSTTRSLLLRKPNHFQTTIEFFFSWVISQLRTGNTYVLKIRDPQTGYVVALYVLDPDRVCPYITSDGGVYYALQKDELSLLPNAGTVWVPASEIIHDRMYTLYHPLVGLSPVFACGIQAMQGSAIVSTSAAFFKNRGLPAGILTAPGHIPDDTAQRLKTYFDDNYTGQNAGKVAVLGDALKFESLGTTAIDAQLIEQLKMTGEMIAACYHVPGYKIGVGPMPTVNNTAALNQQYYEQCLQFLIEKMEARLDEGLELKEHQQVWFDIGALLRMDPQTRSTVLGERVKNGIIAPNEARREDDLPPVEGGDTPFLQQQNYSLGALALRDKRDREKTDDVQGQAMNGAQVTSLQGIITSAATGQIPPETARASILAAFPLLSPEQVDAMISPLSTFTPKPTEPAAQAQPAATPAPKPEDEDEDEEDMTLEDFAAYTQKQMAEVSRWP
jgi:HK97 family phage portal protein